MEKKTLGWAVQLMEMLNFLLQCAFTLLPVPVPHSSVHCSDPELLQSCDLPHCPARSPSNQRPGGKALSQLSNIPLSSAFLIWKRKHRKALPEKLSSPTLTLHKGCTPSHRSDEWGWLAGMGTKRKKAETEKTSIHRTCWVSSKQGVNAGPSPYTGVMNQGRD